MACSCSLQRAGFSYLQALPPQAMEQAMCPGMTCRKRSPTFVYFGVGRPVLPRTCRKGFETPLSKQNRDLGNGFHFISDCRWGAGADHPLLCQD